MPEQILGRDAELAALRAFVSGQTSHHAALIIGEPGIGKTTLWEAGIEGARRHGLRVLAARPSGAEARFAHAVLLDLFDGVASSELEAVAAPQRRALEIALLRGRPDGPAPQPGAIAVGFLNGLRVLARGAPVVVAVDDLQWLDPPSADALTYAARRLDADAIRFLVARRPGEPTVLERALEPSGLDRVEVGPLSLGATRNLLARRLDLSLPRHVLRRVHEATLGNPLYALELGRSLRESGTLGLGEEIPVPVSVEDLLGTHVAALPGSVRRLLLAVALGPHLRVDQFANVVDSFELEEAVAAGALVVDGDRVRPSHPLLAAAASERATADEKRDMHRMLSALASDEGLRAQHLALASSGPDGELAAMVAAAADAAAARGAVQEAVDLAEHALRLTPAESPARTGRVFAFAERLDVAGQPGRITDLLLHELGGLARGKERARAHLLLSEGAGTVLETLEHLEHALVECGEEPELRAGALAKRAVITASTRVERVAEAETWALEALSLAEAAGPAVERWALTGLAWARALRGRAIDDLVERFESASDSAYHIADSLHRVQGARLAWRGEMVAAGSLLTRLIELAEERDEPWSSAVLRLNLCDLAMRCGEWATASRLLDEWDESAEGDLLARGPFYERCRALVAAGRGDPVEAERWASPAIRSAEVEGQRWSQLAALRARGIAALLAREPERAAAVLRVVWEHTRRAGVEDPGAHPVAPDLVESLVALGELEEARAVTRELGVLATRHDHPWARITAQRCDALVRLSRSAYDDEAADELAEAATAYSKRGLLFDRARALLQLGRAQRRLRKWGVARVSLERAVSAFEEIGSTGWAQAARSELARVGGRKRRAAGELTATERRVAELAVDGLSNKEIARALVVTVPTVETHLSRAYAKLGVRSRTQLAGVLPVRPRD